jgi:hypothetical protein
MMITKRLLLSLLLILFESGYGGGFGIVNNSSGGVTPEDSICFSFFNLDSLGRNIGGLDTTKIIIFNPGGDSCFSEIVAGISGRIKISVDNGDTTYRWAAQVSDIDGDGQFGQYTVKLTAKSDQSGGWLKTPHSFNFQLAAREFDDALVMIVDSLQAVIDSLQNFHNWVGNFRYTNADSTLTLKRLYIGGANGSSYSVYIHNTNGTGAVIQGSGGGTEDAYHGLALFGSQSGSGLRATGGIRGYGATLLGGTTSGHGIYAGAQGSGYGLYADGVGSGYEDIRGTISGNLTGSVGSVSDSVLVDISGNLAFADTIANRVLEDSAHYQGGSAGNGSGLYARKMIAYDSTIDQVIPGTSIAIRNLEQTALLAQEYTDSRGRAGFNLEADSILVVSFAPGYIFESFDTVYVSGPGTDTVFGSPFDPGEPAAIDLCRLYGFLYNIGGAPERDAVITAWLPSGVVQSGGAIVSPYKVTATSDSTGYFYLDLIPSPHLVPNNSKYEISITRTDGTILRQRILVPDLPGYQLTW